MSFEFLPSFFLSFFLSSFLPFFLPSFLLGEFEVDSAGLGLGHSREPG